MKDLVIRPPLESESVLLLVASGCPYNGCTFCAAYRNRPYRPQPMESILADIDDAASWAEGYRRVFLGDGDAMNLPTEHLLQIIHAVRSRMPWVARLASYGSGAALARKTDRELRLLRKAGLAVLYLGLESGDDTVLQAIRKRGTSEFLIRQGKRAEAAGFRLCVTFMLGIGGVSRSEEHARATAAALSAINPHHAAALCYMPAPGTPLHDEILAGRFTLPDHTSLMQELRTVVELTTMNGLLLANHASNLLPFTARLPRERQATLNAIDKALADGKALRSSEQRHL